MFHSGVKMASKSQIKQEEADLLLSNASSNQSGSNDFVKKLFQMLQEDGYKSIVRWTKNGDSFVVIDTNEFTKEILPRHFKHSNFASFVRQLNKYDFHKVKISNEAKRNYEYGDDAWEFKHPEFRMNDRNALENIKRKVTTNKKSQGTIQSHSDGLGKPLFSNTATSDSTSTMMDTSLANQVSSLHDSLNLLKQENSHLHREFSVLQSKYKSVVDNLVAARSFDERYYNSMNVLVSALTQAGIKLPPLDFPNPHIIGVGPEFYGSQQQQHQHQNPQQPQMMLHRQQPQHINGAPGVRSPLQVQLQNERPQHQRNPSHNSPLRSPNDSGHSMTLPQQGSPGINPGPIATGSVQSPPHGDVPHPPPHHQATPGQYNPGPPLLSKESQSPASHVRTPPVNGNGSHAPLAAGSNHGSNRPSVDLPQIITTNIPNPKFHVLLVEDDNVCIQLCRKFLVKYGCQVTVVTDGLNAISTVESTKYDLVLMDIVMPNLDGATATSVIRSFDTKTPIIAMTGNIEDNDLVTYLQNGMSDILAKPFTKDDLYSILTKHLLSSHELQQLSVQQAQEQEALEASQAQASPTDHPTGGAPAQATPQTNVLATFVPGQSTEITPDPTQQPYLSEELGDPLLKKQRLE